MTFSIDVKDELGHIPLKKTCCKQAELAALAYACGTIMLSGREKVCLYISTENAAVARRAFMFLKDIYSINTEILVRKNYRLRKNNSYVLIIPQLSGTNRILADLHIIYGDEQSRRGIHEGIYQGFIRKKCCKKAYLRGSFLGAGSVSDPEKGYHLEFITHSQRYGTELCGLLNHFDLHAKVIERKRNFVVYLKEGEHIVELLSIIGAHAALLSLENVRIYKDIRNSINRLVNCETANLSKTVDASIRQSENIKYIQNEFGLNALSPLLREIAELRLEYPDSSLKELGELLNPPVGKSGINHRLRKLDNLAEHLREEYGDKTSTDN